MNGINLEGNKKALAESIAEDCYRNPEADVFLALGPGVSREGLKGLPAGVPILTADGKDPEQFAGYCGDHLVVYVVEPYSVPEIVWRTMEGSLVHAPKSLLVKWKLLS